jgi:membrane-associated phospholipid phosphatase
MLELANKISSFGLVYIWSPLSMFVIFQNYRGLVMTGILLLVGALTELIKFMTRNSKFKCLKRPDGAMNCNAANGGGHVTGKPGFPSGHCATAAAFWTGILLIVPQSYRIGTACIGSVLVSAMMWARMSKKCHTFLQCIGGIFIGISVPLIAFRMKLY